MVLKELYLDDINDNLLDEFNRYQEVTKVWRTEDNTRVIKDIYFIERWDDREKKEIIENELKIIVGKGGFLFGVFDNDILIGFALLDNEPIGADKEYLQLLHLHVSYEHRGKGLGKKLMYACIDKARKEGVQKLYISGHSAIETQAFYVNVGCKDAVWLYDYQVQLEPCDMQLEYVL